MLPNAATLRAPCSWRRVFFFLALSFPLALILVRFPGPPRHDLDASWHMALSYFHEQGFRFGREIIFTAGPLGFLTSGVVMGGASLGRVLWECLGKLALAGTLVAVGASFSPIRFGIFYLGVAFAAVTMPDVAVAACIPILALAWVLPEKSARWKIALALIWMAFVSLVKFNLALTATLAVALSVFDRLRRDDRRGAVAIPAAFLGALLFLWTLAGQSVLDFPAYVQSSWHIASSYLAAMSLNELSAMSWTIALLLCALVLLVSAVLIFKGDANEKMRAFFFAIVWYLTWKHGFTRADEGHLIDFFSTALILVTAFAGSFQHRRATRLLYLAPILSLAGLWAGRPDLIELGPTHVAERLAQNYVDVFKPHRRAKLFAKAETRDRNGYARANLAERVGRETIDVFNFDQDELLRARLNYRPRPIFQGYSATDGWLLQKNQRFYESPAAPRFVFARLQSIDGRYPPQEDSLALLELLRRYAVDRREDDYLLLRRRAVQPVGEIARKKIDARGISFGETIPLPNDTSCAVELRTTFRPSLYGRLRALLVQPPVVNLVLIDDAGKSHTGRLVPSIAEAGFLVQPILETQDDLADFMEGKSGKIARAFRLEAVQGTAKCWSRITIELSRLPEILLPGIDEKTMGANDL